MKLFKQIMEKLDIHFSANERVKIVKLEHNITTNTKLMIQKDRDIITLNSEISNLKKNVKGLKKDLVDFTPKLIDDLSNKDYFDVTRQKYEFKKGTKDYLHNSLNNFSKDTKYQAKFIDWLKELGMRESYKDEDELVYHLTTKVYDFVKKGGDDYDTDMESFGVSEHWLTPQEAYEYSVVKGGDFDCEDKSALLYGAIVSALISHGYGKYVWRLKRVDVLITGAMGHALLTWLKRNLTWSHVESTYGYKHFNQNWFKDKDVFKSIYARIWHVFDEEKEYLLK